VRRDGADAVRRPQARFHQKGTIVNAKQESQVQTAIRLPESLLARIDKLVERMSKDGIPVTRAEVHRLAVFRGVAELEADKKKR
jgi:hypothetical protein